MYPIQTHWAWGEDGWLSDTYGMEWNFPIFYIFLREFHDFGGSGVVHLSGGVCAFVGAVLLGPRIGRFSKDGKVSI